MKTKNDLSGDHAELDFQAMTRTAAIAYAKCKFEIERELSDLQHRLHDEDYLTASFPLNAERLSKAAEQLELCADTYHTLLNAVSRNELSVVNKPVIHEVA